MVLWIELYYMKLHGQLHRYTFPSFEVVWKDEISSWILISSEPVLFLELHKFWKVEGKNMNGIAIFEGKIH